MYACQCKGFQMGQSNGVLIKEGGGGSFWSALNFNRGVTVHNKTLCKAFRFESSS